MEIQLFLWPMLVPMILPLLYCMKYKKESVRDIGSILIVMVLILLVYWPFMTSAIFREYTYLIGKILLFVVLPVVIFLVVRRDVSPMYLTQYGIKKEGMKKSLFWCVLLLPFMLVTTGLVQFFYGVVWTADVLAGIIGFFEAFTEEFFFRGVLFILLSRKVPEKIAYATSLASFTLMHPQHISTLFILVTLLQGVLTLEIARRSKNIIGAGVLHGSNRLFQLTFLPWILSNG